MSKSPRLWLPVIVVAILLGGCQAGSSSPAGSSAGAPATASSANGHDHGAAGGQGHDHAAARISLPVGDGTRSYEVGYTLRDVRLPQQAGQPGQLNFVVENFRGHPHRRFIAEQSKRMHVYVVREDLAVFRHVHPEMSENGTWTGNLTLPEAGEYRVVAEFVARDEGGGGDHVLLGSTVTVPGAWQPQPSPVAAGTTGTASGWGVTAEVLTDVSAGVEQELRIRLTRPDGSAPALGQYLGTSAHLTGFHVADGSAVHMHPLGAPAVGSEGTDLSFHAELPRAGAYVLFLQVRVDDFLHTLPVPVSAS